MATTYQSPGAAPANAYPNTLPFNARAGYPPNDDASVNSDISKEAGGTMYKNMNYSNASDVRVDMRHISRTPSPTPSETIELKKQHLLDFQAMKSWRYWIRKEWRWWYLVAVIAIGVTVAFTVFHKQIVTWLQPAANWMHGLRFGWLIPIAIFFVISFPPLFGHEILAILCGLVWGLWPGFAIVAAGTFVGEIGNFYAFKYCCAARGEKLERTKLQYACLARVVREGGFKIALIARFSAIPGHFTTAVFSTCGMSIWTFMIAAFLSLPKQFLTVYLGVALEDSDKGQSNTKDNIIKYVVIGLTAIVTVVAMWYIYHLMNKVKPKVIYDRRKARQAKMEAGGDPLSYGSGPSSTSFNPRKSESELPLTANFHNPGYQQWDNNGNAVGYAPDPTLYAPQPQRPARVTSPPIPRGSAGATPVMSEALHTSPPRQNTSSSTASWDAHDHVGGPDAYQMTRSPAYNDAHAAVPKLPPPTQPLSFATKDAARKPVSADAPRPEQTPTQAQFLYTTGAQAPSNATPQSAPLHNPFDDVSSSSPPVLSSHGHWAEPTDASYQTAYGGHSQQPSSDDGYYDQYAAHSR